jgi:hypothetical protein
MIRDIPDEPSAVEPIFQQLKKNFFTGKTRPLAARKAALRNMIDGYIALKEEFNEAITKDLGTNAFFSDFVVHPLTIEEMEDLYSNLEKYASSESVSTPLGKTIVMKLWAWEVARSSTSHSEWPLSFRLGTILFTPLFLLLQLPLLPETALS